MQQKNKVGPSAIHLHMPTRISGLTSPLTHIVGSLVTRVYLLAPGHGNHPCPNQGCINVRATKPAAAEPETVVSFPSFFSSIPPLFKFNLSESESYKTNKNKKRPNKHQPQKQAPRQSRNRLQNQLLSSAKPLHQTQLPPLVRPSTADNPDEPEVDENTAELEAEAEGEGGAEAPKTGEPAVTEPEAPKVEEPAAAEPIAAAPAR